MRWWWRILRSYAPAPEPLDHPRALAPALLDLVEVAEQAALELVKVARLLTGPEVVDEPRDTSEARPLGRMTHDR
jgi:hypothetical protein